MSSFQRLQWYHIPVTPLIVIPVRASVTSRCGILPGGCRICHMFYYCLIMYVVGQAVQKTLQRRFISFNICITPYCMYYLTCFVICQHLVWLLLAIKIFKVRQQIPEQDYKYAPKRKKKSVVFFFFSSAFWLLNGCWDSLCYCLSGFKTGVMADPVLDFISGIFLSWKFCIFAICNCLYIGILKFLEKASISPESRTGIESL